MNQITFSNTAQNQQLTMSSREIAELTGKEHKNVCRVIRDLIAAQILDAQFEPLKFEYRGQWFDYYQLNKRDSFVVVARLSPEFTAHLVDRWQELENQKPKELSRMELIQIALQAEQENIELRGQVAVLEPKAKGLDRIADCTNVFGIRESAKVLKIGQKQLTQYLLDQKVVYRDQHGKIQAYQKSIEQKLVHVSASSPRLFESGEKVFTQVKLTQKLITRIAKWLERGVAA